MIIIKLLQTAMDGITDGAKLIVDEAMRELQEKMMTELDQLKEGDSISEFIESHFNAAGDPFAELKTRHKQDKYIRDSLDYLASHVVKCSSMIKSLRTLGPCRTSTGKVVHTKQQRRASGNCSLLL